MNNIGVWNLGWKDVFDCRKLGFLDYFKCREKVKAVGYEYMSFNGEIYNVNDVNMNNPYGKEKDLK